MEEAVDYLHDMITQNQIDCDYERSGYLLVGTSKGQVRRVEHDFKIFEKWGSTGIERWDRARLDDEFNTDFYKIHRNIFTPVYSVYEYAIYAGAGIFGAFN